MTTQNEIKQLLADERRRINEKQEEKERKRKLKTVEAQIARGEPELKILETKLARAYQRRAKLTEVTNE